jgi:hypothetical protein
VNRRHFVAACLAPMLAQRRLHALAAPAGGLSLPVFSDVTSLSKVKFKNMATHTSEKYLLESMCGGVAMVDYDNDGRLDLFFVNAAATGDPMPPGRSPDKSDPKYWNRLYHNNGDGTFTDVTEKAGLRGHSYGMGVAVGDFDNDGYQDIYVTNFGKNILYHNNGDGTFTDVTEKAGVAAGGWSTSACFVDYDRDGRLDLIVARYMEWDFSKNIWCGDREKGGRGYCHPKEFKPIVNLVYHNNGDGTFTDVTKKCGFGGSPGKGLGIAINDYDRDGWPDIVVANDAVQQQLFHNNGDGTFSEAALAAGIGFDEDGQAFSGMGVDFQDYDNDGWPDIVIGDLANQKYALFHNNKGSFEYVSGKSGIGEISRLHSGWGMKFIDYDNDGHKDIFIAQSHVMDNIEMVQPGIKYSEPPLLLHNTGAQFEDVSALSGAPFRIPLVARGVAFGDLDNDGFIDIAINCNEGAAVILRNGGNRNHWLQVNTVGSASNRDGIGAQIRLVGESGLEQHVTVSTTGSYLSANDKRAHFGLGKDTMVTALEITWPSGNVQKLEQVKADQILTVREPVRKAGS